MTDKRSSWNEMTDKQREAFERSDKRRAEQGLPPVKPNERMKGAGDLVKKVTDKLGIKQCGPCKKRQDALNKIIPF